MNNTLVRTLSGLVFLIVMIGALLAGPIAYAAVMLLIISVAMYEYLNIALDKHYIPQKALTIFTGVLLFIISFLVAIYSLDPVNLLVLLLPLAAIYISFIWDKEREFYKQSQYLIGSIIYIALPFTLSTLIVTNSDGAFNAKPLLLFFVILWISDIGAYVFGMLFGQKNGHKLFPSISPKKSWEGFIGGLISAIIVAILIYVLKLTDFSALHNIILALIINITSVLGDLAESLFKREFGVKDSGSIMPGHGGLLDRFDGALISLPLTVTYIKLLSLI